MIDKSVGSMQGLLVTHLTSDYIGDSSHRLSETVKIASSGWALDFSEPGTHLHLHGAHIKLATAERIARF